MAARTDHIRLDAEHAARLEISKQLQKYQRRIYETAKAHIAGAIADANPGDELDGTAIGEEATRLAFASWFGLERADPAPAIEAEAS